MAMLSFALASNHTFDPGYRQASEPFHSDFYRQQAIAMLDGRLDVPFERFQPNECWFREGKCFGYFGLVPSVVRVGWFALGRSTETNPGPVIVAAGVTIALWAAIDLGLRADRMRPAGQRLSPRGRLRLIVGTALLLGPGGLLTFLSQTKLYYEAIVLMIAGLLVCFTFVARWIADRRSGNLVIAVAAGIVAANSRPAALPAVIVLGLGVTAIAVRRRTVTTRRDALLGVGLAALPVATSLGVVWLKLRTFFPSFETYQNYSREIAQANDGSLQGLRFVPTTLTNYLRPDAVGIDGSWPWFRHLVPLEKDPIVLPPLNSGGLYTEFTASLVPTMPVALACTVAFAVLAIAGVVRMTDSQWRAFGLLFVAAVTVPVASLAGFTITSRYLGDFVPLLAVGTGFALAALFARLDRNPRAARVAMALIAASAVVTLAVNLGLHEQSVRVGG